jgi:phosphoglycolate phosphatase
MVLAALAETGVAPHAAVLVGDTTYDMAMARAGGIDAVGVAWGHHTREELIAAGASRIIESFAELEAVTEAVP